MPDVVAAASANYSLPEISDQPSDCIDDNWTATSTANAPDARTSHTAVWTGTEMIVWGGSHFLGLHQFYTGGKYNPGTDSWTVTSTNNVPTARAQHTALWTGNAMIVWGGDDGSDVSNTGGTYDPGTDSWTATNTTNAPSPRTYHTAVWTGSKMIVWGGYDFFYLNTGGRYDPAADNWTATSTINAPDIRFLHTAVWAASEMVVWGGWDGDSFLNTGGKYCAQSGGPIRLSATKRKVGGVNTVRLKWRDGTSTDIDVYRDGMLAATTPNDGTFIDPTGDTGRARYTYQVCEAGTQACFNEATAIFPH